MVKVTKCVIHVPPTNALHNCLKRLLRIKLRPFSNVGATVEMVLLDEYYRVRKYVLMFLSAVERVLEVVAMLCVANTFVNL